MGRLALSQELRSAVGGALFPSARAHDSRLVRIGLASRVAFRSGCGRAARQGAGDGGFVFLLAARPRPAAVAAGQFELRRDGAPREPARGALLRGSHAHRLRQPLRAPMACTARPRDRCCGPELRAGRRWRLVRNVSSVATRGTEYVDVRGIHHRCPRGCELRRGLDRSGQCAIRCSLALAPCVQQGRVSRV